MSENNQEILIIEDPKVQSYLIEIIEDKPEDKPVEKPVEKIERRKIKNIKDIVKEVEYVEKMINEKFYEHHGELLY